MVDVDARNDGTSARRVSRLQRTPLERAPLEKEDMTPAIRREYEDARDGLKTVEDGAGSIRSDNNDAGASAAEKREQSGFYNSESEQDKTKASGGKDSKKGKSIGFFKKKGPMAIIFGLIFGVGVGIGGSQVFQPFSLLEQFRSAFNSMQTSASVRSNYVIRYQMDHGLVKDPIRSRIFGSDTFKISNKQAAKLAKYGVEYDEDTFKDADGNSIRVLKYDNGSGEIKVITADEADAVKLTELGLSRYDVESEGIKYNTTAASFRNIYDSDNGFFESYNNGSRTWRGSVANWFGTLTMNFLSGNKIDRNRFRNFQQEVAENDDNPRVTAIELMAKGSDEIEGGGTRVVTMEEETDEDGHVTGYHKSEEVFESSGGTINRTDLDSEAEVRAKLEEMGDGYSGGSVLGTAQKIANYGCLGLNFLGGVTLLVTASEALQIINLVTSYFEAIDKVKAGNGENSPINELAMALNEHKNSSYAVITSSGVAVSSNQEANIGDTGIKTLESQTVSSDKTAMESSGIASMYSDSKVNPNDPSVQSFNFSASIKRILSGIGTSMTAFETCAFAKLATNAVSAVQSALEIIGCIAGIAGAAFTFGTSASACSALVGDVIVGAAITVGAALLIAGIISTITPVVSKMLTRDLITGLGGEDLGNALTSGANMYLGNTHRANGGSLSSESKYIEYSVAHQQVVAENAKYERMTKSPFDASSQYTFLGTLMTRIMGLMSINSLTSAIMSTGSVVSSSVVALTPTASAYDIADDLIPMDEYEDICPYLASIGAVGDAYCNPYSVTDMTTIGDDPSYVTNLLDNNFLEETTEDGNVQIDGSSDLAKYILFCDNRASAFGIADQNIVNKVSDWGQVDTGDSTFNNVINSGIGAMPIVGDFIDVIDNEQALANVGYVGGESCVAGNDISMQEAPGWDKAKYYQRFIEDQSLMETMGLIEESAVTAFLDDYYEKNPLDNSYEGMLARYSGLSKETVVALLDTVEYYNYIADYDAATRYAFGAPVVENRVFFNDDNMVAENSYAIMFGDVVYSDVRNRSFAI